MENEMEKKKLEKLAESVERIELLVHSMKLQLALRPNMTAIEWGRLGYTSAMLSQNVTELMLEMIGTTHDLYNPIPGVKLS